jgi:AhpD family alkylhydroperoxidase
MSHTARINLFGFARASRQAMIALSASARESSLGPRLVELINLRVSQINGCGLCIDMHWRDLVKQELEPRHLNAVAGWREAPFFSAREKAALRWAEAMNAIPRSAPSDADFAELREHFSEEEIVQLGYAIAAIRGWNMLNVSLHTQIPEVPPPGM